MAKAPNVAECVKRGNGRYPFGQSLYLVVRGGSALWEYQFRQNKVLRSRSYGSAIGVEPVTLTQARAKRAADWLERRGKRQAKAQDASTPKLFAVARDEYLDKHAAEWGAQQFDNIRRMLLRHAAPLDTKRVDRITRQELGDMLRPIWKGPGSHTGNRVRGMVEKILRYGGVENNPARWDVLADELSNKVVKSAKRPALPYSDVPALMSELAGNPSVQARAVRFIILTAVRQDEALEATWREFDLVNKLWTIPAERMKMTDPHTVPLSDEAIACLGPGLADDSLAFPSKLGGRLSQQTTRALLQDMRPGVTVHGFRSSLATWAQEQAPPFRTEAIEQALAHAEKNKTRAAYLRSELLAERQRMMVQWAAFACRGSPA